MRKPSARISWPFVIDCLESEKGIFFCFIIWNESSFSCNRIDKKTPTRRRGRVKTRTCGRRRWRHSITIQSIWTISVHCPKPILINEQLIQWRIYCEGCHIINYSGIQRTKTWTRLPLTPTLVPAESSPEDVSAWKFQFLYKPGVGVQPFDIFAVDRFHFELRLANKVIQTVISEVKTVPWTLSKVSGFEFGVVNTLTPSIQIS